MDKVFIKNMEVVCIVGILDFERTTKQRLLVNIEVDTDLKKCSKSGDLTDSIDYARMAHLVRDYIINKQAFLLESLAYELCDLIFSTFAQAQAVLVNLQKPDILDFCQGVGIEVKQKRV